MSSRVRWRPFRDGWLGSGLVGKKRSLTIRRDNWDDLSTGVKGEPARLVCVDMGTVITDNGIWRLFEMCTHG